MITIDIETISGVPLTGLLKSARPITSATTRKLRQNASNAASRKQHVDEPSVRRSNIEPEHLRAPGGRHSGAPQPACYLTA